VIELVPHPEGTILPVHAQPGARRNAIVGVHGGALRVAISAPPEKGKANDAIVALLAAALGLKSTRVGLLSGATARRKRFLIRQINPEELAQRLASLLSTDDPQVG
jgi:uncharacterized protein (TIGR00251 family)